MIARIVSVLSLAVALAVALVALHVGAPGKATPPPPIISTGPAGGEPRDASGDVVIRGAALPGSAVEVLVASTEAGVLSEKSNFDSKKKYIVQKCPNDPQGCGTNAKVNASGGWTYFVQYNGIASTTPTILYVDAEDYVGGGSWVSAVRPVRIVVAPWSPPVPSTAANPSVFSDLVAFNWTTFTPSHVVITAGAALVLTLLLGFPTTLLNAALEASYAERSRRLRPITEPIQRLARRIGRDWASATARVPKAVVTVSWFLIAAVISGFADPAFGFTLESLRLLVSLFVAFALLNVLGAYFTYWVTRVGPQTPRPGFPSRPSNLLILALTVIVARLIHLEPTLVFGTVLGLDMGAELVASRKVPIILVGTIYASLIGIFGWLVYSFIPASGGFWPVALRELFSQLAIAGIATLPITLLPFRSLQGETIFGWQRIVWGFAYAAAMLLFLFVLLPMPFSWGGVSEPLVAWILLFVAYSAIAILVWLGVRYSWFSPKNRKNQSAPTPLAK